jgi:riboflavin transporter FmnP
VNVRRWSLTWEAVLIAAAIALQSVHDATSYDAGFMYVDAVGVPAVIASLLLGVRSGVRVAVATAAGIWLIDNSALVGALLKLAATLSIIVALRYATVRAALVLAGLAAFLMAGGTVLLLRVLGGAALYLGIAAVAAPILGAGAAYAVARPEESGPTFPGRLPAQRLFAALACAVLLRGALMVAGDLFFAVPVFFHEPAGEAMRAYPPATIFLWNGVQAVVDAVLGWIVAGVATRHGPAAAVNG